MSSTNLQRRFGERIRFLRQKRDLTQEQLASLIDNSTEYVSHIERGLASPSFATLERLTKALQVDAHELFNFADAKSPSSVKATKARPRRESKKK